MNNERVEELEQESAENESETETCKSCGSTDVEDGYQLALCERCRDAFVNRTVPVWVKIVLTVITVFIAFSIYLFPQIIGAGIEYKKGLKAEADKKYVTALKLYKSALQDYPESDVILARIYISSFYCDKFEEGYQAFEKLLKKNDSDNELVNEVNGITDKLDKLYYPCKEFNDLFNLHIKDSNEQKYTVLKQYCDKHPGDVVAAYSLADTLYELKKYDEAGKIMEDILKDNPDYTAGLLFMAAVCRETGRYDEGSEYCRKALVYNIEDAQAYCSWSRVELKNHKDKAALNYALKAYELDSTDSHIMANLAMVYHYNNMISDRDRMFELFKKNMNDDVTDLNLLNDIISGKKDWRE